MERDSQVDHGGQEDYVQILGCTYPRAIRAGCGQT